MSNSGETPQNGVLYVAEGQDYTDLAVQSLRSLRKHMPLVAVDIMTDSVVPDGLFDCVLPLVQSEGRAKIEGMRRSRFERTLFLDCDTLVVGPFDEAFALLDRFDLCLTHDVRRSSALITTGWRETPPEIFGQHNSGVFLYRNSPHMMAFLQEWAALYIKAQVGRDQVTLRDLLWKSDLRFWVLPPEFNLRRVTEVDIWEPLDAMPRIVHSHHLLRHLRGSDGAVTDFETILNLERASNEAEWQSLSERLTGGLPDDIPARFRAAWRARRE